MLPGPPSLIQFLNQLPLDCVHVQWRGFMSIDLFQRSSDVSFDQFMSILEFPIKLHCLNREFLGRGKLTAGNLLLDVLIEVGG